MSFASRQDAGQKLGRQLLNEGVEADVVIGLPRGGVIVAAEIAHLLQCPLEVLVVRKIGHPGHREFAVGALAENNIVLLDEKALGADESIQAQLTDVINEEKERLRQYQLKFHPTPGFNLQDRATLIVDDGLATGATMEAAILSARNQGARKVAVAVPVGSESAIARLERIADAFFALINDPDFEAVGAYYDSFSQVEDEEVINLLKTAHASR